MGAVGWMRKGSILRCTCRVMKHKEKKKKKKKRRRMYSTDGSELVLIYLKEER